jgi:ABC-2 type transport system permease protein
VGSALVVEALKLRRSTAARLSGAAVVVGVSVLTAGFTAVARSDGDSQMAIKVRPMLIGSGWEAHLGLVAQVLSVAIPLAVGIVVCWVFGREHTDGTFGSLFALPTSRLRIAGAKLAVLLAWGVAVSVGTVALSLAIGLLMGLGAPDVGSLHGVGRCLGVAGLALALTMPLAYVSSVRRGYLPGITALIGIIILTQVVTVAGAGGWFPYAAPGLWAGMGGRAAAEAITAVQLILVLPVGVAGVLATLRWWSRAEVV